MLALTIDIEDWYHVPSITGSPFSKFKDVDEFFRKWKTRYDYLTKPTEKVLDLLDKHKIKATFFVVADITEHYPGLVEEITIRGHEIACHGLHHACKIDPKTKKPLMTRLEFKERTIKAKRILEKVSGQEIIGYRAPNAYIAGWMIDILDEIGFKYDSSVSVNSIYNKSDSLFNNVDTRPYYPAKGTLEPGSTYNRILEIPWPYFQLIGKFPTAGGPMLRILGSRYIQLGLNQSLKRGNTIFYFHPIDISNEKFPLYVSSKQRLYWISKGETTEKRINKLLTSMNDNLVTCSQIIKNKQY